MAVLNRTLRIELSIRDGYDTRMTETLTIPGDFDLTRLGTLIERKVGSMYETVSEMYPPTSDPIVAETILR